ncbi:RagB/SusD family nutrient uptake outer membrane protein [uncultured Mucilaginibacter sp.]|uniref:RagB/SusD family nutrient uptake outer membrane protein n=1 Tax=uncultured Mucilaginibacter sp. TaxID=797541 RepID=UPI0025FD3330|nr:RagB/SusD family nutrient uptake outer membrane protein [uncultured Mucilaginibacter sp.]
MKKIFNRTVLGLAIIVAASSCNKEYLETNPTNQVSTADAFSSTQNAWAALNGIHRTLYMQIYGSQPQGGQSGNKIYMDMMGEDMVLNTTSNSGFRSEYQWTTHRVPTSTVNEYHYSFYYMIIANANMILENIDNAAGPQADKNFIKGQALAYRAWSYFQMVQLFGERYVANAPNSGLGVPLVLKPTTAKTPRNTVAEVYAQINKDLDEAITNLQGYNRATDKSQFNINVAKGFKARVALTQQNWADAIKFAQEARSGFTLMTATQYQAGFNDYSNPEWMWGSRMTSDQTNYFYSFFAYISSNYASTATRTSPKSIFSVLYNKITNTDVRKKLWEPNVSNTAFPIPAGGTRYPYISNKFRSTDASQPTGDFVYMRAAEMYLIEAEAQARSGNNAAAATALYNLVVTRDPSYTLSTKLNGDLIEEIMIQRRIELWGEGFRFYDLKRTNSPLDRTGGNHTATNANNTLQVPAGDKRWQFLIPQEEIIVSNGVVTQNPL